MSSAGRPTPDYYAVLGVTREVSPDGLRNAYRRMARRYHPDRNLDDPAGAAKTFVLVKEAYDVLRHPETRRAYDAATDLDSPLSKHMRQNMRAAIRAYWRARYGLEDEKEK